MSEAASNAGYDGTARRSIRHEHADFDDAGTPYRSLVDESPDAIIVHGDGRVVYANATALRWLGAQYPDQVHGHAVTDFAHPESIESALMQLGSLRHHGDATHPTEGLLVRLDGTTIIVEAVTARTTWNGGVAYHVTMRDLTFQRTAQRALREQAALVDRVSVAIIATTTTGLVTKWNRAAEALYRRPASSALALPVGVAVGAALDPAAVLHRGGVVQTTHHTSDGQPLMMRVSVESMNTGFVLVCTDTTEAAGSERLLRSIISSLDEGILILDGKGGVVSANPSAARILGVSAATLTGGNGRGIHAMPTYDVARRRISLRDNPIGLTVATGRPFQAVVIGIDRSDGQRIWLRVGGRRVDGGHHDGSTTLVSFSDITAERVAQERLTYRATHDALTGLPNRGAVLAHISESLRAQGERRLGAVLFIDLDNLKAINDTLGHDSGDELLRSVAERLRKSLGTHDLAGRLGGDEFVALVTGRAAAADLDAFVGRLEHRLLEPMPLGAATVRTQASIGVTVVAPDDQRSAIDILRDADSAMYETKAKRRRHLQRVAGRTPNAESASTGRQWFRSSDGSFDGA
jgi:diguanylate cyclase (GGDEF)-like protein/PAS domain S-box-containing protein